MSERQAVDRILAELPMSEDGTGHVVNCGWDDEAMTCGCATLPARLAAALAAVRAEALREAADDIDALLTKAAAHLGREYHPSVPTWLRERADRIEADQ